MIVHNKGPKAERDRTILLSWYRTLALNFYFKPLTQEQLAKMNNFQIDRLCRDIWDRQPSKEQRWYAEKHRLRSRSDEFKWRWFWLDLFHPPKKPKFVPALTATPEQAIPFVGAAE